VAAVRIRDILRVLRLVFLIKNTHNAHLTSSTSMVELHLACEDHHGDTSLEVSLFDDETASPPLSSHSPFMHK
jgi:hypothetical protein